MAELSGLDMVREIIGQINNLRRLVTINGKKYKWDGKKYVRAVDGKTFTKKELVSFVKDQKFEAPKTAKVRKGELKVDGKTVYKKRDIKGDITKKAQGLKSRALKLGKQGLNKGNQVLQNAKLRINPNPSEVTRRARSVNKRIGKGGVAAPIIDAVIDKTRFPDRTANFLTNMMAGQNMNLAQRDAFNAQQMAKRNNQKLAITPNAAPTERDIREDQLINFLEQQKTSPIKEAVPNANTDTSKVTRETNPTQAKVPLKKKAGGFNPNAPDMGYSVKKKTKKNEPLKIAGKLPSPIQKKLLKAGFTHDELTTLVNRYNKKYRSKRGW